MNKAELANKISEKFNLAKKTGEEILEFITATITETIKGGGEVTITSFGTFSAKNRAARTGVNPQRPGEKIQIPAVTVPKFKAGKGLKDALKGK